MLDALRQFIQNETQQLARAGRGPLVGTPKRHKPSKDYPDARAGSANARVRLNRTEGLVPVRERWLDGDGNEHRKRRDAALATPTAAPVLLHSVDGRFTRVGSAFEPGPDSYGEDPLGGAW
jgi:hypothetical protein